MPDSSARRVEAAKKSAEDLSRSQSPFIGSKTLQQDKVVKREDSRY